MAENKIKHIEAAIADVNEKQIAVEPTNDSDLGFRMWGGKDSAGNVTKWLAKDKDARVKQLQTAPVLSAGGLLALFDSTGNYGLGMVETGGVVVVAISGERISIGEAFTADVFMGGSGGDVRLVDPSTGGGGEIYHYGEYIPKIERNAITAPTTASDETEGYSTGSWWWDNVNEKLYFCKSAATGAAVWVEITGGSFTSPLTTKGDLSTYDSADARLPVGTDGQVLQADSAETTGLKWTTLASMYAKWDPDHPPASPDSQNDEFDYTGTIDPKWTLYDPDSNLSSLQLNGGDAAIITDENGSTGYTHMTGYFQTPPAYTGTWTAIAKVSVGSIGDGVAADVGEFHGALFGVGDSTGTSFYGPSMQINNANITNGLVGFSQVTNVAVNAAVGSITTAYNTSPGKSLWLRLDKTTTAAYTSSNTYRAFYSFDGKVWVALGDNAVTFSNVPDHFGVFVRPPKAQTGTVQGLVVVDYVRVFPSGLNEYDPCPGQLSTVAAMAASDAMTVVNTADDTTTALTVTSARKRLLTGSGINYGETLPDATTLDVDGIPFVFTNASSEFVYVKNSDVSVFEFIAPHTKAEFTLLTKASAPGTWEVIKHRGPRSLYLEGVNDYDEYSTPSGLIQTGGGATLSTSTPNAANYEDSNGFAYMDLGTTSASYAVLLDRAFAPSSAASPAAIRQTSRFQLERLSTGTDPYTFEIGIGEGTTTAASADSALLKYDNASNGDVWEIQTSESSNLSQEVTAITVEEDKWIQFDAVLSSDRTRIDYWINNVHAHTATSNIMDGYNDRTFGCYFRGITGASTTQTARVRIDWCGIEAARARSNG